MNHLIRYAITLTTLALISTETAYTQNPNVLLKDSFEEGKTAPDGWQRGAKISGVRYVYDKGRGKTGKRSLSLQKSARRYFPIAQWYRILPYSGKHTSLKVSGQVRAQQATKAILDVQFLDENGNQIGHKWASYIGAKKAGDAPVSHDWKEYSGEVSIPAKTRQIVVALQIYGPGKVWFDDIEATFVDSTAATTDKKDKENEIEVKIGKATGRYLLVPSKTKQTSGRGHALLIVLPGGNGSADFHPFVKRIHEHALSKDFILAQPIARQWTKYQRVVWPTEDSKTSVVKYTTEELVAAVIEDISKKQKIDASQIYLLAWSSGGPAAYATLLQKKTQVSGALIAMSVFKPKRLPEVTNAKNRSIYLLHSQQDLICPFWMAKSAHDTFTNAGVRTNLVDYPGGHGWKGNVYGNIRKGIDWLQNTK